MLHISYKDHVTNEKVRAKIQQAIGPHEDLMTIVKRRKLQCYGRFPFIRSGQNHLARHSERGKKTKQTEEEVRRQNQGMDRPGVRQVPESSGEQCKMEKTGCKIISGAPKTIAVKELMMMMMRAEGCTMIRPHRIELECWLVDIIIIIISIIINPLTARVVGAPQIILQPLFSIFLVLHCPPGLAELQAYPFPDVVFPPLPLSALSFPPFTVPCKMVLARPDERET